MAILDLNCLLYWLLILVAERLSADIFLSVTAKMPKILNSHKRSTNVSIE